MNLNFYHYVTVIAESGSLSTASERLFITQSALTQALKKMEQTFGGPLFLYQNRSMQITPLGQIVLETARAIEDAKVGNDQRYCSAGDGGKTFVCGG